MSLQPLHPISHRDSWVAGEVVVDSTAVIAPGVLLQADPGCRIRIGPGAVVGMGTVIHAYNGAIEVGAGVNVGAAVLLVGRVTVGDRACVGAQTTVMNAVVNMGQAIAPGSLIGVPYDSGPSPSGTTTSSSYSQTSTVSQTTSLDDASKSWNYTASASSSETFTASGAASSPDNSQFINQPTSSPGENGGAMGRPMPQGIVYGKVQLEKLMVTMFPHRYSPNGNGDASNGSGSWDNGAFNNNQDLHRDEWED
ncbi:MAG: hypothetical protein AAGA67_01400 [Cyanobacteria bacterium P01_F01_bin.153]